MLTKEMLIKWSDNTCTVGWTNIHGYFNSIEMEQIQKAMPEGRFTNTFYANNRNIRDWRAFSNYLYETGRAVESRMGFYFSFPLRGNNHILTLVVAVSRRSRT